VTEVYWLAPPNAVEFVIAWLRPLGLVDVKRPAGETLPYRMVNGVAAVDDPDQGLDQTVVSVHTFDTDYTAANDAAVATHQRMLLLVSDPSRDVTLTGGVANADWVETVQKPIWLDYGDNTINRFVARYRLGLSFTT
jgi:hypothetical protein